MAYPLTGASTSATVAVVLPAPLAIQIVQTRVAATLTGHSRSATVHISTSSTLHVTLGAIQRQWGLAPTFQVVGDSWGVF